MGDAWLPLQVYDSKFYDNQNEMAVGKMKVANK